MTIKVNVEKLLIKVNVLLVYVLLIKDKINFILNDTLVFQVTSPELFYFQARMLIAAGFF